MVGHFLAPSFGLLVEVRPIGEGAPSQKIVLAISKIALHFGLPIRIANGMGDELDPKDLAETFHFRGHLGLRATAVSHDDAGVVNDTSPAGAVHEAKGGIEKDPGLEAGEGRVVLDKELPGVTEDQPGTLGLDLLAPDEHLMGRSIVLHFLAGTKFIGPGTTFFLILSQIQAAHDSGQGAVGDVMAVFSLEDLVNPDDIARGAFEYLREDGRDLLVGGFFLRPVWPFLPDDPSDRVSGDFKELTDLPDLNAPLAETQNGLLDFLGDHDCQPS